MESGLGDSWPMGTSFVTSCRPCFLDIAFSLLRVCRRSTATTGLLELQISALGSGLSRMYTTRWALRQQQRQPWRLRHERIMRLQVYTIWRSCPVMRATMRPMLLLLREHTMQRPVGHSRFLLLHQLRHP